MRRVAERGTARTNTFETRIAGHTFTGRAHSLSAWFVLALRLTVGYAFLHAGFVTVAEAGGNARGYLANVAATYGNPLQGMFAWMAATPWFVDFVNVTVPWGELLIGLGTLFGALMMALFYFGNWDVAHGYVNGDPTYTVVFLAVAVLGAGRILGLDAYIERLDVGGKTLVERYPVLGYVLG